MSNKVYISQRGAFRDDFLLNSLSKSLDDAGFETVNKDEEFFNEKEVAQYQINQCEIFIFILSYQNDSFSFFELGYATALAKVIIIITHNEEEVPYFLRKYPMWRFDRNNIDFTYQIIDYLNKSDVSFRKKLPVPINLIDFLYQYKINPGVVDKLSENQFIEFLFVYFQKKNYNPSLPPNTDFGYDLILENFEGKSKAIIEVKKYSYNNKVSISTIQQLVGALTIVNADIGIIITTSTFTYSAIDYSKSIPYKIFLWDINYLISAIE